jgi:hypothetical protein
LKHGETEGTEEHGGEKIFIKRERGVEKERGGG